MKKMMKKLTLGVLALVGLVGFGFMVGGQVNAQSNNSSVTAINTQFGDSTAVVGLWVKGTDDPQWEGLIQVFKNVINWILGILSLITLGVLLWGGFQMVTAAGDDGKYKKGFTILKQAGIGLAFIGLSWFVVSIIFSVIGSVTGG